MLKGSKSKSRKKLTQEEIKLKSVRARRRFKSAIRFVIDNSYWLSEIAEDEQLGENVQKNIALLLQRRKNKQSLLNRQDKILLGIPKEMRTPEEKAYLVKLVGGLNCFRKFPQEVQHELAVNMLFQYIQPDKVIYRQDAPSMALYFLVSGEVEVTVGSFDPIYNEMSTEVVGTMTTGQMFGEMSLFHNIPRTETVVTITDVEVLILTKDDFSKIFKALLQESWSKIMFALTKFRYFDFFDDVAIRECCLYSGIIKFKRDDIIYGLDKKSKHKAFFVLRGSCRLIESLPVIITKNLGAYQYRLFDERKWLRRSMTRESLVETISRTGKSGLYIPSKDRFIVKKDLQSETFQEFINAKKYPSYVTNIFMQVCIFNELSCFGIGEDSDNRHIVAISPEVECLVIPKYWLMMRNKGNVWTKIVQFLNINLPSTQELFHKFVESRNWEAMKIKMVNSMISKQPCSNINNVPYSIRLKQDIDYGVTYH